MKILIGGSPCTHWSIAQTKNRETEASGIGWELFLNYRIARDKYQPDFFLYENNKSMSPAIRAQITAELGVEPALINSALVSAQNRQRLYWAGKRNQDGTYSQVAVEQPVDRGILLRDILESGVCWREKAYTLKANYANAGAVNGVDGGHFPATMAEEPVEVLSMYDGMSCGHIALDKLGAEITAFYATEIDKYAVQTTQHNYPDTMQLGDAFQVRAEDWHLPEPEEMEAPANG